MSEPVIRLEVRLSPQLSLGNEAKSLLWIWEQILGEKFFLAVMQNDTSASAVLHS